ncbi:MAG: hypothetical protein GY807_01170, partial [Gammaproteobacteria bacterium]|nr:hypothetical protein [Gammaproteobacteria bacterium]
PSPVPGGSSLDKAPGRAAVRAGAGQIHDRHVPAQGAGTALGGRREGKRVRDRLSGRLRRIAVAI